MSNLRLNSFGVYYGKKSTIGEIEKLLSNVCAGHKKKNRVSVPRLKPGLGSRSQIFLFGKKDYIGIYEPYFSLI